MQRASRILFALGSMCIAGMTSVGAAAFAQEADDAFQQISRPGSVNLESEYALENLTIPREQIHTLLPRDAIPALTNPKLESVNAASSWLDEDARIIVVSHEGETVGVPLRVVDWHEIVNLTVGGEPIAATYCPLCDSATVFSREVTVEAEDGRRESVTLEFGVSGALFNSNVLMYDRRDKGLWSQLAMRAVSGPLAGTPLTMMPVQLVPFDEFSEKRPEARVVSRDTGHRRDYTRSPYESYFANDRLMVPVAGVGEELPPKTLGLGVSYEGDAWFIPEDAIGESFTLETPAGPTHAATSEAGVVVKDQPEGVRTAQSFYYSWSAFFPETQVVRASDDARPETPGLQVGDEAPDARLRTPGGGTVRLSSLYGEYPLIVTFYRGGWCPFCNRALADWRERMSDVENAGARFVAISTESPDHAQETIEKQELNYSVYSDAHLEASRAFRVLFTVDDATKKQYKEEYGLDIAESNASDTWQLPAPATFVIDADGVIRYVFADWDYKKRADPDKVLQVVRELANDK